MDDELDLFGWVGGTVDGKYRVDEVVGRGGFGVVYRAHHLGFDQTVALKCLRLPKTLSPGERERFRETFLAEGRLLHQLSRATAGIVQALDLGAAVSPNKQWTPYLVLEWLDGRPLDRDFAERRAAGQGGRSISEATLLLSSAARALAVAHAQGVAHRDIKPANLFLANIGGQTVLKVLDFGIAKVMAETESLTRAFEETGASLQAFTARYGAPEQFSRRYGATGPWTDVFALALVFVETVTGRHALDGTDAAQLFIAASDEDRRPTLRAFGHAAPDALEAVLTRALSVDPRERYANAGEFWPVLENAVSEAGLEDAAAAPALLELARDEPKAAPGLTPIGPDAPTSSPSAIGSAATELSSSTHLPNAPASEPSAPRRSGFGRALWVGLLALLAGAAAMALLRFSASGKWDIGELPIDRLRSLTESGGAKSSSSGDETRAPAERAAAPAIREPPLPEPTPIPSSSAAPVPAAAAELAPPLGGVPQRSVAAAVLDGTFLGAFRVLSRSGAFGLDFGAAAKQCADVGMSLCTETQWKHTCTAFPELGKVPSWTASLKDTEIVIRGGTSCDSAAVSTPSTAAPERFALCCERAIAMTTENLQKQYLTTTMQRVLALEQALNQRNVQALLDMSEPTVTVDDEPKTHAELKALIQKDFAEAPELVIATDTCEVSVQAKKVTKRVRKRRKVAYETQGWTADCRQTAFSGSSATSRSVGYTFNAQSKLREIVTKPE